MKTFIEFISEANNKHGIPDDEYMKWREARDKGEGPASMTFNDKQYEMRGKGYKKDGTKRWAVSPSSARIASRLRRTTKENETRLTYDELLDAAKRDLGKTNSPKERSAAALDAEETGISKLKSDAKERSKETGVKHSIDHGQALQRKTKNPENQERLDAVLPGHTLRNQEIAPLSANASKQNTAPKPGEFGYGLTRSGSQRSALDQGDETLDKIDSLRGEIEDDRKKEEGKKKLKARMSAAAKARGIK